MCCVVAAKLLTLWFCFELLPHKGRNHCNHSPLPSLPCAQSGHQGSRCAPQEGKGPLPTAMPNFYEPAGEDVNHAARQLGHSHNMFCHGQPCKLCSVFAFVIIVELAITCLPGSSTALALRDDGKRGFFYYRHSWPKLMAHAATLKTVCWVGRLTITVPHLSTLELHIAHGVIPDSGFCLACSGDHEAQSDAAYR